jgi:exonuclease SbcD
MNEAIVRLVVDYPRDFDRLIDDAELRNYAASTFEFHLVKRPQMEARVRLPAGETIASLTPLELLEHFWKSQHVDDNNPEVDALKKLAGEIIQKDMD